MKKAQNVLMLILALAITLNACKQDKTYIVTNTSGIDLIDYSVILTRSELQDYLPNTTIAFPVTAVSDNGDLLPSQCDDMNDDGIWDELVFQCDLEAGESKKIIFTVSDTQPDYQVRTNIRFGRMEKPFEEVNSDVRLKTNDTRFTAPVYQMEGPAWENDVVAFRNYYDARNGIDIFGKRTKEMVMDSVGVNGREYHTLADWGMDILKVGNSLGAGAIAIAVGDSLYRIGPCEQGQYKIITEGPIRSVFELTYKNIPAGDRFYNVIHRISIHAGDHFYRSKVWISDLKGDEELVTGIVNLHGISADTLSENFRKIMFSHGAQGYSGEMLGMGIIAPLNQSTRIWQAPDSGTGIVNTHLIALKAEVEKPSEYYFVTAWETGEPDAKSKEYFVGLLKEAAYK